MRSPEVSLGIPVYNGERFIGRAIECVLEQTYGDFELILSDNASTDSTREICRDFAARDRRIRYTRSEELLGAMINFNRAAVSATGKYFKWCGVDDFIAPDFIEKTRRVLDENPDVVLCSSKTTIVDAEGKPVEKYDDSQTVSELTPSGRFEAFFEQDGWVNNIYGLMRRSSVGNALPIGNFAGSDIVFLAELALHGQFIQVPEFLFFRSRHEGAFSYDKNSFERLRRFFYPSGDGGVSLLLRTWRHIYEHYRSLSRTPMDFRERMRVFRHISRMIRWKRYDLLSEIAVAVRAAWEVG